MKGQLVETLKAAAEAAENPAMKGWAYEMEQLDIITDQSYSYCALWLS